MHVTEIIMLRQIGLSQKIYIVSVIVAVNMEYRKRCSSEMVTHIGIHILVVSLRNSNVSAFHLLHIMSPKLCLQIQCKLELHLSKLVRGNEGGTLAEVRETWLIKQARFSLWNCTHKIHKSVLFTKINTERHMHKKIM